MVVGVQVPMFGKSAAFVAVFAVCGSFILIRWMMLGVLFVPRVV